MKKKIVVLAFGAAALIAAIRLNSAPEQPAAAPYFLPDDNIALAEGNPSDCKYRYQWICQTGIYTVFNAYYAGI